MQEGRGRKSMGRRTTGTKAVWVGLVRAPDGKPAMPGYRTVR